VVACARIFGATAIALFRFFCEGNALEHGFGSGCVDYAFAFDTDVHGGSWQGSGFWGRFNGRRPTRESLGGNGDGAPPVSRFLYRPHYRRIKGESQGLLLVDHGLHGLSSCIWRSGEAYYR